MRGRAVAAWRRGMPGIARLGKLFFVLKRFFLKDRNASFLGFCQKFLACWSVLASNRLCVRNSPRSSPAPFPACFRLTSCPGGGLVGSAPAKDSAGPSCGGGLASIDLGQRRDGC